MSNINDFVIEDGVLKKYIGSDSEVIIPDGVESISKYAFSGQMLNFRRDCTNIFNIKKIVIPASVVNIGVHSYDRDWSSIEPETKGDLTFYICKALEKIEVDENNPKFKSIDGNLYNKGGTVLLCYAKGKMEDFFAVPDSVITIGASAFGNSKNLRSVALHDKIAQIDTEAFINCTALESINVPCDINIGTALSGVFKNCTQITTVTASCVLPYMWRSEMSKLTSLQVLFDPHTPWQLLKECKIARPAAIGYLLNREAYTNEADILEYKKYIATQKKQLLPIIFEKDMVEALSFYAELGKIDTKNFSEEFLVPAQKANANQCVAFLLDWQNKNVSSEQKEKVLEKELTKDPFNAADMKKLWTFETLGDGTLLIKSYKGTDTDIIIPDRVGDKKVSAIDDELFSPEKRGIPAKKAEFLKTIKKVTISQGVNIGKRAFCGCVSLTDVVICDGVKSIGNSAFMGCKSLVNITAPNSIEMVGTEVFKGCVSLYDANGFIIVGKRLYSYKGEAANLIIPEGVISIEAFAFEACRTLENVVIPEQVVNIGENAFSGCSGLVQVKIPDGVQKISKRAFSYCKSLVSVDMPKSITFIDTSAFYECVSLSDIIIPDGVTTIESYAFSGCIALESIMIPNSVTSIGNYAFEKCTSLTINCEAETKPEGWWGWWNRTTAHECPVVWGYKKQSN